MSRPKGKKGFIPEHRGFRKYMKKPLVIWACQMENVFEVETLEGMLKGKAGDFLIIGIRGEKYPCDKEIFLASYEEVK